MQRLIAILQIKSRNEKDFKLWLNWYIDFIKCDLIYILNDNSLIDLNEYICDVQIPIIHLQMKNIDISEYRGDIKQLANLKFIIDNYIFNKNDLLITPDCDEFWWYNKNHFNSFKECINFKMNDMMTNCLCVPWILMNNNTYLKFRTDNYINTFLYRNTLPVVEHKSVIKFIHQIDGDIHNLYRDSKSITEFDKNYSFQSIPDYSNDLRLYHFRYTTIEEFEFKKCETISNKKMPKYFSNDNFENQIINGIYQNRDYNILDLTLINELKSLTIIK